MEFVKDENPLAIIDEKKTKCRLCFGTQKSAGGRIKINELVQRRFSTITQIEVRTFAQIKIKISIKLLIPNYSWSTARYFPHSSARNASSC